jgi:methionine-rich copper-binding protein CopC
VIKKISRTKKYLVQGLALSILSLAPAIAYAHAHMKKSVPEKDAVLDQLPPEIRLEFSEKLETKMSKADVKNSDSNDVVSEKKLSEESKDDLLVVKLSKPSAAGGGHYVVHWKAVSKDSHKMEGHYEFTVRPSK